MILFFLAQLDQHGRDRPAGAQPGHAIDLGLQRGQPGGDPLGVVGVVPQIGGRDLLLQLGDLRSLAIGVDDGLDRAQCLVKVSKCDCEIGSGHNDPLYWARPYLVLSHDPRPVPVRSRPHCEIPRYGHTDPDPPSGGVRPVADPDDGKRGE